MEKFFEDKRDIDEVNASYVGKNMLEIMQIEQQRREEIRPEVDKLHNAFVSQGRSSMLTVQKLIDYLKTQDPNGCILAYEPNSFAYIELPAVLPSSDICNVAEDKEHAKKYFERWYKDDPDAESKVRKEIEQTYRYAQDSDVVIRMFP